MCVPTIRTGDAARTVENRFIKMCRPADGVTR
jgi:hypothetical protein